MSNKLRFVYVFIAALTVLGLSGETLGASLNVNATGDGAGKVSSTPAGIDCGSDCNQEYTAGKKVTLKAKPEQDSTFSGWTGGGCAGTGTCTVIMNSDLTVNAAFATKVVDLSVSADELDFGEVEIGGKVSKNVTITNTGTADVQVEISGLQGTEFSFGGASTVAIKPQKSKKLKVTFKPTDSDAVGFEASESIPTESEGDEESVSPAAAKIIIVEAQIHLRASNKSGTKSRTVTVGVKGSKAAQAKQYQLKIEHVAEYGGGKENGFTFKEEGKIPFEMTEDRIHCYDSTGQFEIPCLGSTKFTIEGKWTVDDKVCTWNGSGFVTYVISGGVYEGKLLADLMVAELNDGSTICCESPQGKGCNQQPILNYTSFFQSVYATGGKFLLEIPFRDGGYQHLTPTPPPAGFQKVDLWWELIVP